MVLIYRAAFAFGVHDPHHPCTAPFGRENFIRRPSAPIKSWRRRANAALSIRSKAKHVHFFLQVGRGQNAIEYLPSVWGKLVFVIARNASDLVTAIPLTDVGQQRRDHCPLRGADYGLFQNPFVHHSGLQPQSDQPQQRADHAGRARRHTAYGSATPKQPRRGAVSMAVGGGAGTLRGGACRSRYRNVEPENRLVVLNTSAV